MLLFERKVKVKSRKPLTALTVAEKQT